MEDDGKILDQYGRSITHCSPQLGEHYVHMNWATAVHENVFRLNIDIPRKYSSLKETTCLICSTPKKPTNHHVVPQAFLKTVKKWDDLHEAAQATARLCRPCHDKVEIHNDRAKYDLGLRLKILNIPFEEREAIAKKAASNNKSVNQRKQLLHAEWISDETKRYLAADLEKLPILPIPHLPDHLVGFFDEVMNRIEDLKWLIFFWRASFTLQVKTPRLPPCWALAVYADIYNVPPASPPSMTPSSGLSPDYWIG
jgi:hypothetical protein